MSFISTKAEVRLMTPAKAGQRNGLNVSLRGNNSRMTSSTSINNLFVEKLNRATSKQVPTKTGYSPKNNIGYIMFNKS